MSNDGTQLQIEHSEYAVNVASIKPTKIKRSVDENSTYDGVFSIKAVQKKKIKESSLSGKNGVVINAANPTTPLEKMVQKRFIAGFDWKNHQHDTFYTIPLMAVGSRVAGKRLRELFTSEKTRQLASSLYLFRDNINHGAIVVYYGEFTDRKRAEDTARLLSPLFNNTAFDVVSIRRAMRRVKK